MAWPARASHPTNWWVLTRWSAHEAVELVDCSKGIRTARILDECNALGGVVLRSARELYLTDLAVLAKDLRELLLLLRQRGSRTMWLVVAPAYKGRGVYRGRGVKAQMCAGADES